MRGGGGVPEAAGLSRQRRRLRADGWRRNLMQRASFQSLIFGFYTAGFSLIAPIIARLGLARTMFFGTAPRLR